MENLVNLDSKENSNEKSNQNQDQKENQRVKFEDFKMNKHILDSITRLGFEYPTEIQAKTIPAVLEGKDVVGESATGSGKTLAFGVGAINKCVPKKGVQALILVPTRELAEQVMTSLKQLNTSNKFGIISIYGGVSITPQMDALRRSEIVIATPGRLKDHIQRETIDLSNVSLLILDEADRMLDMGFVDDIESIVKMCPKNRQTLFFSATFPPQVQNLSKKYLQLPFRVKVNNQVDPKLLKQVYYDVNKKMKLSLLVHLLKHEESASVMVFCNTRNTTDLIVENLFANKVNALALHGGFTQSSRTKVIEKFKAGKIKVLVCTDVAARGIHVDNVSHVYNYDIPKDSNDYVHRIGRTARAGSDGQVINLICDFDHDNFSRIFRSYDFKINKLQLPDTFEQIKVIMPKESESRGRGDSRGGNSRGNSRGGSSRGESRGNSRGESRGNSRGDSRGRGESRGNSRGESRGESRGNSGSESRGESRGERSPRSSSPRGDSRGESRGNSRGDGRRSSGADGAGARSQGRPERRVDDDSRESYQQREPTRNRDNKPRSRPRQRY